jgi:hypothetical protein
VASNQERENGVLRIDFVITGADKKMANQAVSNDFFLPINLQLIIYENPQPKK